MIRRALFTFTAVAAFVTFGGCSLVTRTDGFDSDQAGAGGSEAGIGGSGGIDGGGTGGAGTGGSAGEGGVECVEPDDCPALQNECEERTCQSGVCGTAPVAKGTALATQTTGDCQIEQCDGAGQVESAVDDTDLPDDDNECTVDTCDAGQPVHTLAAAGTACGTAGELVCNEQGECVGCNVPEDCSGVDDECQQRTCVASVCGVSFVAQGTPVASQVAGDCKLNQCDGAGAIESANDDTDVSDDLNDCTTDTCSNGTPQHTAKTAGTACGTGGALVCNASGVCVGCNQPADCAGQDDECKTRTCVSSACGVSFTAQGTALATQTAQDCKQNVCDGAGNATTENDDTDVPVDNLQCTADVCTNGVPSNPPVTAGTACSQDGGIKCDAAGACVACLVASDCGADTECKTFACSAGVCSTSFTASGTAVASQSAGDCKQNVCDGAGNVTAQNDDTDLPVDGNQCTDDVCTAGVPSNPSLPAGTTCSGGQCNAAGACVACLAASDCGTDTECQTFSCSAGVCSTSFTASGTAVASQSSGDCKLHVCDGAGNVTAQNDDSDLPVDGNQCTDDVCTNGVPSHPPLPAGTTCTQNGGTKCDGTGVCVECTVGTDCPSLICTNFVCVAASCEDGVQNGLETDVDCGGGLCPACAPTATCSVPADCQSGVCTAGVCGSPAVVSTTPADGASGVAVSSTVGVEFTAAMSAATLVAQTAPGACTGTVQVSADDFATCIGFTSATPSLSAGDTIATLTPATALAYGALYRVRVTTGAQDAWSNALGAQYTSPTGFTTVPPLTVGFCRLQFPTTIEAVRGGLTTVYGRVYVAGLTDLTGVNDPDPRLIAEVGVGPDASDPAASTGWTWTAAFPNAGYDPSAPGYEPNNDEYQASLAAPSVLGDYDFAYRFSGDAGATWTYCDATGSSDGYSAADAGQMVVGPTLFFSEYVEGSASNKALEIYNPESIAQSLLGCSILNYSNGSATVSSTFNLPDQPIAAGGTYVVCHQSSVIVGCNAYTSATAMGFNGNDAIELRCGSKTLDVIGQIGFDPGSQWGTGLTSTADNTLRRKCEITTGDTDGSDVFDPAAEWIGFATDTFDGLGSHVVCP
jgi:hypothetical protein